MIRPAIQKDIDAVLSLYKILFAEMAVLDSERMRPAEQAREFIEDAISNDKFHLLVAEFNGEIKGFCIAQQQTSAPYSCMVTRDFGYVFDLVVDPNFRGEKVGHLLLDGMKLWAKEKQLSHLELTVLANNHRAIKFYEREGLTEITRTMGIKL